jgi:UDP-glucose 4-epimerase
LDRLAGSQKACKARTFIGWHRVYTSVRAQPVAIRIEICDRLVADAFPRLALGPPPSTDGGGTAARWKLALAEHPPDGLGAEACLAARQRSTPRGQARSVICRHGDCGCRHDEHPRGIPVKLLVTGGAGYIGSIVGRQLVDAGHEVVVLDNLERGHRQAVGADMRLVEGDLRDRDAPRSVLAEGFDGVLHFAAFALVGESVEHPERYYRTNVVGTLNLLEAMRETGVARLVFSSTCAVYGEPDEVPILETVETRPTNPYGASKLAVDRMISDFSRAHGLGAVSLRYFNVAGASHGLGEDHDPETHLIPNVLRAAMGVNPVVKIFGTDYPTRDGTAVRDYIHIDDLSAAHLLALDHTREGAHQIFNLGNGSGFSVREVIAAAGEVTGIDIPTEEAPRRPGDPPMLVAAGDRIRAELGWKPEKPSVAGMVADAWEFAQAHPRGYSG